MAWTATPTGAFIAGRWTDGARGTIAVENPATGEVITEVADVDVAQGIAALDAAVDAAQSWAATPARQRAEILRKAFDLVIAHTDDLASVMTAEMGKPLAEARGEVAYGAEFLRWFSEEAARIPGGYRPSPEGATRQLVTKRPVGPCLLITPWNFPLAMATRKIAPALAAGCPVVLRPASLTPLTALLLVDLMSQAGVPDGVVNVITCQRHDVTDAIIADPRLRKLSFTGSTKVGQVLLKQAADQVLRVSMELGGNAPLIVFEDADLDVAVPEAKAAKLRNMGEACTAANRMLVHESVVAEFSTRLAAEFEKLTVGNGALPGTDLGPLISDEARERIHSKVIDAVASGARVLTGGQAVPGPGYGYQPTVLVDVPPDADLACTEVFGPVAPITSFRDEAEAIALANDTPYGLAGYVFTADMNRALRITESLQTGMIGINCGVISNAAAPFGGVKASGLGREGADGIEEYLETVYVCLPDPWPSVPVT